MNGDASASSNKADNIVPRQRIAASRQPHYHAALPLNDDGVILFPLLRRPLLENDRLGNLVGLFIVLLQAGNHLRRRDASQAHQGIHILYRVDGVFFINFPEPLRFQQGMHLVAGPLRCLLDELPPLLDVLLLHLPLKPVFDF